LSAYIDVIARVASGNDVVSPLSGVRAAFVQVELLEAAEGALESLGAFILGDVVTLGVEDASIEIDIVARRAELRLLAPRTGGVRVEQVIPELVPLLARARGGVLYCRERLVLHGERLRVRAHVERVERSPRTERLVVRDDLGPVTLDEVLEAPP
jgi:hypothetical protein